MPSLARTRQVRAGVPRIAALSNHRQQSGLCAVKLGIGQLLELGLGGAPVHSTCRQRPTRNAMLRRARTTALHCGFTLGRLLWKHPCPSAPPAAESLCETLLQGVVSRAFTISSPTKQYHLKKCHRCWTTSELFEYGATGSDAPGHLGGHLALPGGQPPGAVVSCPSAACVARHGVKGLCSQRREATALGGGRQP